jgi:1,4-alpha-glucan branching enzyme
MKYTTVFAVLPVLILEKMALAEYIIKGVTGIFYFRRIKMVVLEKIENKKESLVHFRYPGMPGHSVSLAGVFNDWDPAETEMKYSMELSVYECFVELLPGDYEYKLVVDGEWKLDDENPNFVSNDFGTLNSVVSVK